MTIAQEEALAMLTNQVIDVVVRERSEPAQGVVVLTLVTVDGSEFPAWTPGAHIDLVRNDDECRQYSLCGDARDRGTVRIAVLREESGRGFSRHVCDTAVTGSRWRVRGPRSHFDFVTSDGYLFIAGGIGITPILPMIAQAERAGADWTLLYGGRSRASMAFVDELKAYGDRVRILPQDEAGLLPLAEWLGEPSEGVAVYCCGPEPLLQAVESLCATWPKGSLHTERFAPKELEDPALKEAFEIHLAQKGLTLVVPPEKSILEVVKDAGIPTLSACQEGTCGTCETAVLQGVPDHRDSVLDEEERESNEYMMICISRSCSPRLVLDL